MNIKAWLEYLGPALEQQEDFCTLLEVLSYEGFYSEAADAVDGAHALPAKGFEAQGLSVKEHNIYGLLKGFQNEEREQLKQVERGIKARVGKYYRMLQEYGLQENRCNSCGAKFCGFDFALPDDPKSEEWLCPECKKAKELEAL